MKYHSDATLELSLRPRNGLHIVDLRFFPALDGPELQLLDAPIPELEIDLTALRAVTLNDDYGQLLTRMVFGPVGSPLREALARARRYAEGAKQPLRLLLRLDPLDNSMAEIAWERLCDPNLGSPLFTDEQLICTRYITSTQAIHQQRRPRRLRVLIAVASPTNLGDYGLTSIAATAEVDRARASLENMVLTVLAREIDGRGVTMERIVEALQDEADILYLICHGAWQDKRSYLWLERNDGRHARVEGEDFAKRLGNLKKRPRLIVLASCHTAAGVTADGTALTALGPRLVTLGIAAVVAMQGAVSTDTASRFTQALFRALSRNAHIDLAVAGARSAVRDAPDWWRPVLFMGIRDGRIWLPVGRMLIWALSLTAVIGLMFALVLMVYTQATKLQPMPEGWNLVIAGAGVEGDDGIVRAGPAGDEVGDLIFNALRDSADNILSRKDVGSIVGNPDEQRDRAAALAKATNADVVVYGIVRPGRPGWVTFTPAYYIAIENKDAAVYGPELFGEQQFGSPIEVKLKVDEPSEALIVRLTALKHYLTGLQNYVAEDYDTARRDLTAALAALKANTGATDAPSAAVLELFLGALEGEVGNDETAEEHIARAHDLWPEYSRPYLARGSLLYRRAVADLQNGIMPTIPSSSPAPGTCFEPPITPELPLSEALLVALVCYDQAEQVASLQPDDGGTPDLAVKLAFSRGSVYFVLSDATKMDLWEESAVALDKAITQFENATPEEQARLRRVSAHAYARRGLLMLCRPDCTQADVKDRALWEAEGADYPEAALGAMVTNQRPRSGSRLSRCSRAAIASLESLTPLR